MSSSLRVHFLPQLTTSDELTGRDVVVVDVLRATTTIAAALDAGALAVVPCLEVEEARRRASELGRISDETNQVLLGGERGGLPIDGFDLGNSPAEYTSVRVSGKSVVFTTTNGTRAMQLCGKSRRAILAAFVNLSAVVEFLTGSPAIDVLCAGTNGEITREDVLLAGALVEALATSHRLPRETWNDQARLAGEAWSTVAGGPSSGRAKAWPDQATLSAALAMTTGGQNLRAIGRADDVELASRIDSHPIVPRLDPKQRRIGVA